MSNILHITASVRGEESVSNRIGNALVASLSGADTSVTTRDLSTNNLPFISHDRFQANLTPATERTAQQAELAAISDTLIAELQAADTLVIASPIYNFNAPASLKAWADLVARAGTTFQYTENGPVGLLKGKKAYIAIASGGTPVGADFDFMSSWLKFFLSFLGISETHVIAADGIMGGDGEEKITAALEKASSINS